MLLNDTHIRILSFLNHSNEDVTLMDIGREVGLDHAQKVQDKLNQLEREGYISRSEFGGYEVSRLPENDGKVVVPFFGFAQCGNAGAQILKTEYPKKKLLIDEGLVNSTELGKYFITRAKGDSMYPFIENGDFVLIKVQNAYYPEDQVLVVNDGYPKIKKVIHENEDIVLRSFNPEYKDFVVEKDVDNHIVGVVKKTFSKDAFIV